MTHHQEQMDLARKHFRRLESLAVLEQLKLEQLKDRQFTLFKAFNVKSLISLSLIVAVGMVVFVLGRAIVQSAPDVSSVLMFVAVGMLILAIFLKEGMNQ